MKKILRQYIKQVIIIVILMTIIAILNTMFVKSSIRGEYDTVTVGITKGAEAREVKRYLKKSFKEELDFNKKIEVEAVGSFGTEFRIKSDSLIADERDFIDIILKDKYEEISVSGITTNPEANYRLDYIMYGVYIIIILGLGFGILYFLSLIPTDEEINVKNIKKRREEIIEEENKKLLKEKRLEKKQKQKKKKSKVKKKNKINKKNKIKKSKDKIKKKDKKTRDKKKNEKKTKDKK